MNEDEWTRTLNEAITRKYTDMKIASSRLGEAQTRTRHARMMWAVARTSDDAEELNVAEANEQYCLRELERYENAFVALKWPLFTPKLELPKAVVFDVEAWLDGAT